MIVNKNQLGRHLLERLVDEKNVDMLIAMRFFIIHAVRCKNTVIFEDRHTGNQPRTVYCYDSHTAPPSSTVILL